MSKNITIQEGGVAKQLTVDKLKTNLVGGGTQLWVPEDSVEQTTKNITANGTYKASDDGYYGYSEVTVNVPGGAGGPPGGRGSSIVGKDGDGDDAIVTVDHETGELEEEKLPNHIYVVTPPYNPRGIYADGETIDVGPDSGFDVRALLADGSPYEAPGYPMGDIPLSELTVEPTVAVYDESTDTRGEGTATGPEGMIPGDVSIDFISGSSFTLPVPGDYPKMVYEFNQTIRMCHPLNHQPIVAGTNMPISFDYYGIRPDGQKGRVNTYTLTGSYTHDGKTAVWGQNNLLYDLLPEQSDLHVSGATTPNAAWVMLYGTIDQKPAGSPQTITVSWPRPGDGQVLTTTFDIRVGPSPSGDDDN